MTILVKSSNRHLPKRKFGPTRALGVDKAALFGEYMLLQALWPWAMWLAITGLSRPLNLPPSMPASDKICFLLMLNCLPQLYGTTVALEQSDMFHSGPCKAITSQLDVLKPIEHTTNIFGSVRATNCQDIQ